MHPERCSTITRVEGGDCSRRHCQAFTRATDEKTGRHVAIKVPHPELEADPVLFERFNDAKRLSKLLVGRTARGEDI